MFVGAATSAARIFIIQTRRGRRVPSSTNVLGRAQSSWPPSNEAEGWEVGAAPRAVRGPAGPGSLLARMFERSDVGDFQFLEIVSVESSVAWDELFGVVERVGGDRQFGAFF